jgi:phospholipid/cholesterol/gamma-HCH transport system substrate-binding protein
VKDGQGTLGQLINSPQLHDELIATIAEIKAAASDTKTFVNDTQGILAQVKSGKGTLGTLLYDEESAASIKATVKNFHDVSDKIAKGEGTLGKLLNDDSLYIGVQNTLKKADRAIDGLGDSGPITAVGVVANSLF